MERKVKNAISSKMPKEEKKEGKGSKAKGGGNWIKVIGGRAGGLRWR